MNLCLRNSLFLLIFGLLAFFIGNNVLSLTNPDEVFYAGTAKEMARQCTWTTPYLFDHPQFEKPVLTYDLIRIGFLIFGENSFAARFFPAFFALLGGFAAYWLGKVAFNDSRRALISALMLMSSGLYIGLARTVFTDMIFTVFILLSLASFYVAYARPTFKSSGLIFFHIFAALAVLTKGPLGYAIPLLTIFIFLLMRREIKFMAVRAFLLGFVLMLLLSVPWYALMFKRYGDVFIKEFFYNDHWRRLLEAEHLKNDRWYFYPASMLGCMFPWVLFAGAGLWRSGSSFIKGRATNFQQFLILWILVVFIVFQVAHSKLVSYIFPLFPAMALLTGDCWVSCYEENKKKFKTMLWWTFSLCAVILLVLLIGPLKFSHYVSFTPKFLAIGAGEIIFLGLTAFYIWHGRIREAFVCFSVQLPLVFFGALLLHKNIEPYVSTQAAAQYLSEQPAASGKIISSKFFARSVKYYLNKDVALMNINGKNYFSPHPIENLDSHEELIAFLRRQGVTYGVVSDHDWEDLRTFSQHNGMNPVLLKVIGDKYIVKISAG